MHELEDIGSVDRVDGRDGITLQAQRAFRKPERLDQPDESRLPKHRRESPQGFTDGRETRIGIGL